MEIIRKTNKNLRNFALVILALSISLIIFWLLLFYLYSKHSCLILLYIGIGLFLAGMLVLIRVQFVLWAEKKNAY